mgnify:CR=1 FL=1
MGVMSSGFIISLITSIIYVGEESGTLDTILNKSADYYEEEADAAITKLVSLMEPLMIIIMGIAVAMVFVAVPDYKWFVAAGVTVLAAATAPDQHHEEQDDRQCTEKSQLLTYDREDHIILCLGQKSSLLHALPQPFSPDAAGTDSIQCLECLT